MEETVGAIIKRLREERKLSKARLARESGISSAYVVQIEQGSRTASEAVLRGMAKALRIPAHHLLIPAGYYPGWMVADAKWMVENDLRDYEDAPDDEGPLTDEQYDRLLHETLEFLKERETVEGMPEGERRKHEIEWMRQQSPLTLTPEEYWGWDETKVFPLEGWEDLTDRDRDLLQQMANRLLRIPME